MCTIPVSSKKSVFNKEANEPLNEVECDAWKAYLAWESFLEGNGTCFHPDLIKGTPLEHVPEVKNLKKPNKKALADKVNFDNPVFLKALEECFEIEKIDQRVTERLGEIFKTKKS